jgi:hypothetical protein
MASLLLATFLQLGKTLKANTSAQIGAAITNFRQIIVIGQLEILQP